METKSQNQNPSPTATFSNSPLSQRSKNSLPHPSLRPSHPLLLPLKKLNSSFISASSPLSKSSSSSPAKPMGPTRMSRFESFHIAHKVPVGDTPYVKAKRVQLVDKDPERAIAMFWGAINAGDRVDSALKDMAIVMKQQNRAEEAVEAIKSLRHRCSDQAQESLDNILLDLYKRCGRLDDQVALLKRKLLLIQQGLAFNGKRTKTARSQGRKFQVSVEQEATRLLGNLGWALMQKENYAEAEDAYRRALIIGPDSNKMCNLGICLMKQGRIAEARETLKKVRPAAADGMRGADSHLKAFERAQEMLQDLESDRNDRSRLFKAFLGSSSIWQPHPCTEYQLANANSYRCGRVLNIDAPPFYSSKLTKTGVGFGDTVANLKRTRSGKFSDKSVSKTEEEAGEEWPELPDDDAFNEAIMAAVLGPVIEDEISVKEQCGPALAEGKMPKRLRVFKDITLAINSPKGKVFAQG